MTDRILPAPDIYASCPYDGEVLRYYTGVFSSVYIAFSPFVQPDATFYERYLWEAGVSRKETLAHCKPVLWKDIAKRCRLSDVAAVDIALRTRIHALRSEFGNESDAERLKQWLDTERIVPPTEGIHSDMLHNRVLELFQALGHDWVWVGDEMCTQRKLYWIDDLKDGIEDPLASYCNVFSPDKSLLWTVHWDSHFSFLCSASESALRDIGVEEKLEGFFCEPETEVYWSLQMKNVI